MKYIINWGEIYKITTGITWVNLKTIVLMTKKEDDISKEGNAGSLQKADVWWPEADEWLPTGKRQKERERERGRRHKAIWGMTEKFLLSVIATSSQLYCHFKTLQAVHLKYEWHCRSALPQQQHSKNTDIHYCLRAHCPCHLSSWETSFHLLKEAIQQDSETCLPSHSLTDVANSGRLSFLH